MVIRVHGGIITDQMLSGGLRFFKLSSAALDYFEHTISTGITVIPKGLATTAGQDEDDYDGAGSNGTFVGGTGFSMTDTITMSDGSVITVDMASSNIVIRFTVTSASVSPIQEPGSTITQIRSSGPGIGFTMTLGSANEAAFVSDLIVSNGQAVPNSVADRIFRELSEKATIVIINVIDDNNIHFACDDSGFGWDTPAVGDAAAEMLVAIKALGVIGGGGPISNDPPVPASTDAGITRDLNVGGVTLTETTPFELT